MASESSHPAIVTSRRLSGHIEKWSDRLTRDERRAIHGVQDVLRRIAYEDADAADARKLTREGRPVNPSGEPREEQGNAR